jgi:hypothetical protein
LLESWREAVRVSFADEDTVPHQTVAGHRVDDPPPIVLKLEDISSREAAPPLRTTAMIINGL